MRQCEHCEKEFEPRRKDQRFCPGSTCRQKYHAQRRKRALNAQEGTQAPVMQLRGVIPCPHCSKGLRIEIADMTERLADLPALPISVEIDEPEGEPEIEEARPPAYVNLVQIINNSSQPTRQDFEEDDGSSGIAMVEIGDE